MRRADRRRSLPVRHAIWPLVAALVVIVPLIVEGLTQYWITLCINAAITALILLSIGILTDRAGMLAVAPMSFAGIGAWATGFFSFHGWPGGFLLWLLLAGVATIPFGVLVGLPALRLRGINLAVITLSFAVAMSSIFNVWDFPGNLEANFVQRPGSFVDDNQYFLLCWIVFVVAALVIWAIGRRPLGTAWRSVARSERATAAMGMSVARTKLGVFVLSALIAGIGGALLVGQIGTATPATFSPLASLSIFAVAIMVGAGYPEGAAVGGMFSAFAPEIMRQIGLPQDLGDILFAIGAIQVLKVGTSMSGGWRATARKWTRRRQEGPSAPVAVPTPVPRAPAWAAGRADGPPALRVQGLNVRFGNVIALDHVDLTVPQSTVCGLIGPNGAGKSTFVDAVTGFLRGYEGSIELCGQSIDPLTVHRRVRAGVRRTFQQERTVPALSVGEYVRLASRRRAGAGEVASILAFVGGPSAGLPIAEVDVGARRLVEVAGCLAARPHVLLLDEPTAGLGQAESKQAAQRIAEIPVRFGCSVLLIEHDMEVVSAACADVTVLDFGRVIANGAPTEVLEMGAVVSAYLSEPGVAIG
jgi:branched-chain amino acid transport system ATP-binding protein/branched-chain amino acid transport system permease protein